MIIENPIEKFHNYKKIRCRPRRWIKPIIRCPCVLIWNNQAIPLKSIKYNVAINGGLANVTLSQVYHNTHNTNINVDYKFPVNENVVFGGMEAIFRNRKVEGKIKEKNQAKAEFLVNKALGNTVAYAEQLEETEDIMKVQLGNFPPGETLTIVFKYMTRLDVFNDVNWGFRIPATLTPRYNPGGKHTGGENVQSISPYSVQQQYTWEINVHICWPGGAKRVVCLSHPNKTVISNQPGMIKVNFNPAMGPVFPNKDFELMIEDNTLFANNCQVAMCDLPTATGATPKYAAMLQFVPSLYKWYADKGVNMEEGVDIYSDDNNDFLMESTIAEYIFIIDRSGSMRGGRIEKAKRALIFFLKSLPYNSKFNVISFGTGFENMFPIAVDYNNQNLMIAINNINRFGADKGGTNILGPIQNAFSSVRTANYQRNIFLLTDGAVSNTTQVLNVIEANCVFNQSRVYTIGIGNGCSELLVKRSAKLGNGRSVIIGDNENVEGKIINLLNESFTPSLTNFNIEFDQKYICALSPMPNQYSHITRGEPFVMYALIKNDIEQAENMTTQIKVNFYDSVEKRNETRVFNLSLNGCIVSDSYHKMCVKQVLENKKRVINSSYLDPVLAAAPNIETKLAVAYQVLSAEHTAFICVIHQNQNGAFVPSADVIVPTLESVDYNEGINPNHLGGYRGGRGRGGGAMRMKKASTAVNFMSGMMLNRNRAMPMPTEPLRSGGGRMHPTAMMDSASFSTKSMKMSKEKGKISKKKARRASPKMMEIEQESLERCRVKKMVDDTDSLFKKESNISASSSNGGNLTNDIVISQEIRGGWKYDQNILNKIGVNQIRINQIKGKVENQDCLMTILVLAWLLKNEDQSTVGIIVNKGMGYLRKNKVDNYKELVEEAKLFF